MRQIIGTPNHDVIIHQEQGFLELKRDKFGFNFISYYIDEQYIIFGYSVQEIYKICKEKNLKLTLNPQAVSCFLNFGCVYEPMSIFNEIHKVECGTIVRIDLNNDKISKEKYYSIENEYSSETLKDPVLAKKQLRELLFQAVENAVQNQNFGVFLSGGIDSSLVTALASKISAQPVNTFSIGFKEARFNEAVYAEQITKHFGTQHQTQYLSKQDALDLIPDFFENYFEPYSDASGIPTMLVSKIAKQQVDLALLGDGGDELFFSYGAYLWAKRFQNPCFRLAAYPLACGLQFGNSRFKRIAQLLKYESSARLKSHILSQEQYYFTHRETQHLIRPGFYRNFELEENFEVQTRRLTAMEAQSLFDIKFNMPNDLIPKVRLGAGFYGLKTAAPIYTENIIHFSLNLDERLKYQNNVGKYLLKEVLYDFIPKSFYQRPKWGFGIPLQEWLQKDLYYLIEDYLNPQVLNTLGILDSKEVQNYIQRFNRGETYLYNRLWILIILCRFLREKL